MPNRLDDTGGSDNVNPLKSDPELQVLLKKLHSIKKYKKFQGWKSQFLSRLEQFLYQEGMKPAEQACNGLDQLLTKFVKSATKVQDCIANGQLSDSKKTVRASLALNEMCKDLTVVNSDTVNLVPGRSQEERELGFTKFHIGAVLIRQGFHQYITMKAIEDALEKIGEDIQSVMDKQQHDLFLAYKKQVQRFCDVMSDLNLYEVMMKCLQFAEEPEDESEEPDPINIVIKASNGNTLRLELDPTETIGNVKDAIEPGCGIGAERQVLKFHGKELGDNSKTLMEMGIVDHSTLTVEPFKVPITVNNAMDGKQIQIMIDPAGTMGDIKQQLREESGLSPENQRLLMNGLELVDDNNTAEFYGIKAGSELDLEPKSIKVSVRMPDGKTHEMEINPADTGDSIKAKIEQDTGMAAPRQVLKSQGTELCGGKTVKDMGLKDGSSIIVEVFKVPITVNTVDGKQIKAMIDPTESLGNIKIQLEKDSGLNADNQKLSMNGEELADDNKTAAEYGIKAGSELNLEPKSIKVSVEMPDGKIVAVELKPSDTSDDIKSEIEKETGMTAPRQVLKVAGKTLSTGKTVTEMGIEDGSTIKVDVFKVPVTVNTMDGKQIKVLIDPTDSLGNIKVQLEKDTDVPSGNQKLFMNGEELSDDNKAASEYGIKSGSELDMEPRSIKVSVEMPDGKVHSVGVKPSDTSDDIKIQIEKETGMAAPRQVLKFEGKKLPNGKTVKEMGIQDGSPIKVEVFRVPITVTTMDGKQIKVMIDPTDKLGNIKVQLEKESGVPSGNQKLFMNGDELADDKKSAGDYGIKAGSELDMEPRTIKVSVEMPDGKTHMVDVKPSDTSDGIKSKIEEATGMAAPRQVVKMAGKALPNGMTAKDMGIQDGSALVVDIFKIPVKVTTMDGKQIKVLVDPADQIKDIKSHLVEESGIPVPNQKLFLKGNELVNNKTATDCGVKAGSELDLEPKTIKVSVEMPDGNTHTVEVAPSDNLDGIKVKIADTTGMAAPRQVLKLEGKELPAGKAVRDMGIREGSTIGVDIFKVSITVKTKDGKSLSLKVEPCETIDAIKKSLQKKTGIDPPKQCLKFCDEELTNGRRTVEECGIQRGSILTVEPHLDPIIFVDIKSGSLFAVDREEVIEREALTPNEKNKLDFREASSDAAARDKILKLMLDSPNLGVATQVVVQQTDVEDYDLEEAEKVKNVWGVKLKKREKNKKGEELIFVDPKTGATGELSRQKYIDTKFITPRTNGKGDTIEETEKDTLLYDKYIFDIRNVFGVKSAT